MDKLDVYALAKKLEAAEKRTAQLERDLATERATRSSFDVTDAEWTELMWAARSTVDGEPRVFQLNEILSRRPPPKALEHLAAADVRIAQLERDLDDANTTIAALRDGQSSAGYTDTPHLSFTLQGGVITVRAADGAQVNSMHLRNISASSERALELEDDLRAMRIDRDASSARLNEVREWAEQHDDRTTPDGTKQRGYVDAARAVLDMLRRAPAAPADALGVRVEGRLARIDDTMAELMRMCMNSMNAANVAWKAMAEGVSGRDVAPSVLKALEGDI
jgi:hypothetical protein